MFCNNCGTKLPDEAKFCHNCGKMVQFVPVDEEKTVIKLQTSGCESEEIPVVQTENVTLAIEEKSEPPRVNKMTSDENCFGEEVVVKNKRSAVSIILIVLAIAIVISAAVMIGSKLIKHDNVIKEPIYATFTDDKAYIFYGNGKKIVLGYDIEFAFLTADQKKVVVLEEKGDLYWSDISLSKKTVIRSYDEGKELDIYPQRFYHSKFLVYEVKDEDGKVDVYRYDFSKNDEVLAVSRKVNYDDVDYSDQYSKDISFVQAYYGNIKVLKPDSNDFVNIAQYDKNYDISLCGVSSDGQILSWVLEKDNERELYIYYNGNAEKIMGNVESKHCSIEFAPDNSSFVVYDKNQVVFWRKGDKECTMISFAIDVGLLYSENGLEFSRDSQTKSKGFFVVLVGESSCNLYYVEFDTGEKHKLLSKILDVKIYGDRVVYVDDTGVLYTAEIDFKNYKLNDSKRISSDIYNYTVANQNTDYIYYIKDFLDNGYSLYVYDVKEDTAVKIAGDLSDVEIATDGKTVFYITDAFYSSGNRKHLGVLNVYDAKKDESHKVASDVIINSLTSGIDDWVYSDSLFFSIYEGGSNEGDLSKLCYYDGKDYEVLLSGIGK